MKANPQVMDEYNRVRLHLPLMVDKVQKPNNNVLVFNSIIQQTCA